MIEYAHEDGTVCARPGPRGIPVGSLIESTFELSYGVCEHVIEAVHEFAPETEPEPQPQITVQNILQTIERKSQPTPNAQPKAAPRLALPKEDEPVSADVIERAKVPPKIKVDVSTAPAGAQAAAKMPIVQRYEYALDEDELRELNSIRGFHEPIGGSAPVSPFDSKFSASPTATQQPQVKRNRPISVFDRQ